MLPIASDYSAAPALFIFPRKSRFAVSFDAITGFSVKLQTKEKIISSSDTDFEKLEFCNGSGRQDESFNEML